MWTICDVCGDQIDRRDAVYITNKYSYQFGLVVCPRHARKVVTPVDISHLVEKPPTNPKTIRIPQDGVYLTEDDPNRAPGKPTNVIVTKDPLRDFLSVRWNAPDLQGSGRILGYVITRASPQEAAQIIIQDSTENNITYFLDEEADISESYTYAIAAINAFGTGELSDLGYWPQPLNELPVGYEYLVESQTSITLATGDSEALIVSNL